jgi:cytochrome c-type biogenesis protein CcmH/NrfG
VLEYATNCLSNAVQIDPKSSEANSELGNHLFFPVGRTQEGFRYLEKAVKLDPNNPEANAILGERIGYPGNNPEGLQRAIRLKKKAIELDSSYAFPHLSLSSQYLFMKRYDDAEVELHKYFELAPPNARNMYWVEIIQDSLAKNKKT